MHICFIIPTFYPAIVYGGPTFSTYYACLELAKMGVIINVATTNANGNTNLVIDTKNLISIEENIHVRYFNRNLNFKKFPFSLYKGVSEYIKKCDVVHLQVVFSTPTPVSLFLSKWYKKPILFSPRGALSNWALKQRSVIKKIWLFLFIRPFVKNIHWHATSEKEKQEILTLFPRANITVIPNGVYLNKIEIPKLTKKQFAIKYTGSAIWENNINKIIVSMGRIHKVKAFDVLIKSFNKILEQFPNSLLFIAGNDDGEKANLIEIINKHNLQLNVFFTGQLENKEKAIFLANADVFALASHTENFSNVILESLSFGTPVVASKGTPWEMLEVNKCGKWVHNDVQSFAKAMAEILNLKNQEYKSNAVKFAENFAWEKIAQNFKSLYAQILNE